MPSKSLRSVVIDHLVVNNLHDASASERFEHCSPQWENIMKKAGKMLQAFDRHQQQELKKAHVKIVKGLSLIEF